MDYKDLKNITKKELAEMIGQNIAVLRKELETLENLLWLLVGKS